MRRHRLLLALPSLVLAVLSLSCSKSSAPPPTAPSPAPVCVLGLTTLSFGTVTVGDSASAQSPLTNVGGGTLSGTLADTSSAFLLVGSPSYSLTSGQSHTFTVRFKPRGVGPISANLTLTGGSCGPIVCSGTGQANVPVCDITPTTVDFGRVSLGTNSDRSFKVTNTGGGLLLAFVSGATGDFSVDSTTASYALDGGLSADVIVRFRPTFAGAQVCSLHVGQDVTCPPVVLRGTGYLDPSGFCAVQTTTADTIDFGTVVVGQSADRPYSLRNISSDYWANGGVLNWSSTFTILGDPSFDMSPLSSQTGQIRFAPTTPGVQYAAMAISCEDVGSGLTPGVSSYVQCKGKAVSAVAMLPASVRRLMQGLPLRR